MDWSNERYVRLYTRDTETWLDLSWQARSVWMHLLRKVDRAGVLEVKRGARGVSTITDIPLEVVEEALPELLLDGCLRSHPLGYVVPNYIEAQEAAQSDRQRARESRARRRVTKRDDTGDVTNRDASVDNRAAVTNRDSHVTDRDSDITNGDASVTRGHTASRGVTRCHSDPSQTDPSQAVQEKNLAGAPAIPGSTDTAARQSETPAVLARRACAERLWEAHQPARKRVGVALDQATHNLPATDQGRRLVQERALDAEMVGMSLAEFEHRAMGVIERVRQECERDRTVRYLNGAMWEPGRFDKAVALIGEPVKARAVNGRHVTGRSNPAGLVAELAARAAREAK